MLMHFKCYTARQQRVVIRSRVNKLNKTATHCVACMHGLRNKLVSHRFSALCAWCTNTETTAVAAVVELRWYRISKIMFRIISGIVSTVLSKICGLPKFHEHSPITSLRVGLSCSANRKQTDGRAKALSTPNYGGGKRCQPGKIGSCWLYVSFQAVLFLLLHGDS